jgi:hypothetical protein
VILAVVDECLAKNKGIRSLKYFDQAIAEAHKGRGGKASAPDAPPDPAQVRNGQMIKAQRYFRDDWPDNWKGKPGEPDCDIPDDVLIEAARTCGKVWPPRKRPRLGEAAIRVPSTNPDKHQSARSVTGYVA